MSEGAFVRLLAIGLPVCLLLSGSALLFFKQKTFAALSQLLGAGSLMVVVLAHVAEALRLFPWMNWGVPHSAGHYVDLGGALAGLSLFPLGYLFHALRAAQRPLSTGDRPAIRPQT